MTMKTTKKALLMSCLSLLLCAGLLVGTTFAWFTDTTTTAVNSIQSGRLDVVLEYSLDNGATWLDAEGQTLNLLAADGNEDILWEPGCTYNLPLIRVRNAGNLALKYELVISGLSGDAKLLEVIKWTVNDGPMATSYAGQLAPESSSEPLQLTGHMMESAGNEYQDLKLENIAIAVLATQVSAESDSFGSGYDDGIDFLLNVGGEMELDGDMDKALTVGVDAVVEMDLKGNSLMDLLSNYGELSVFNGGMAVAGRGFNNYGTATLSDITMDAGSPTNYATVTSGSDAQTTYNNVILDTAGGGVSAVDGGQVIFNSGSVTIASTQTSQRHVFYAEGENTVITVNGGDFAIDAYRQRTYACAVNGATIYITGGNFGVAPNHPRWTTPIYEADGGSVIITGGTFGFDPSQWVAEGYEAVKNDALWVVVAEQ